MLFPLLSFKGSCQQKCENFPFFEPNSNSDRDILDFNPPPIWVITGMRVNVSKQRGNRTPASFKGELVNLRTGTLTKTKRWKLAEEGKRFQRVELFLRLNEMDKWRLNHISTGIRQHTHHYSSVSIHHKATIKEKQTENLGFEEEELD